MATIPKSITKRYKMNGASIYQPDKDMGYNLETTYSEGSNRTQFGKALLLMKETYNSDSLPPKILLWALKLFRHILKEL